MSIEGGRDVCERGVVELVKRIALSLKPNETLIDCMGFPFNLISVLVAFSDGITFLDALFMNNPQVLQFCLCSTLLLMNLILSEFFFAIILHAFGVLCKHRPLPWLLQESMNGEASEERSSI